MFLGLDVSLCLLLAVHNVYDSIMAFELGFCFLVCGRALCADRAREEREYLVL